MAEVPILTKKAIYLEQNEGRKQIQICEHRSISAVRENETGLERAAEIEPTLSLFYLISV